MKSGSVLKPLLKIGELSKHTNVPVGTLRYYESLGLVVPAQRGRGGYRYYASEVVSQINFIQKALMLGFSLQEVQHIMGARVVGKGRHLVVRELLDDKISRLNEEIQRLSAFKMDLEQYQQQYDQETPKEEYLKGLFQIIDQVSLPAGTIDVAV